MDAASPSGLQVGHSAECVLVCRLSVSFVQYYYIAKVTIYTIIYISKITHFVKSYEHF